MHRHARPPAPAVGGRRRRAVAATLSTAATAATTTRGREARPQQRRVAARRCARRRRLKLGAPALAVKGAHADEVPRPQRRAGRLAGAADKDAAGAAVCTAAAAAAAARNAVSAAAAAAGPSIAVARQEEGSSNSTVAADLAVAEHRRRAGGLDAPHQRAERRQLITAAAAAAAPAAACAAEVDGGAEVERSGALHCKLDARLRLRYHLSHFEEVVMAKGEGSWCRGVARAAAPLRRCFSPQQCARAPTVCLGPFLASVSMICSYERPVYIIILYVSPMAYVRLLHVDARTQTSGWSNFPHQSERAASCACIVRRTLASKRRIPSSAACTH